MMTFLNWYLLAILVIATVVVLKAKATETEGSRTAAKE